MDLEKFRAAWNDPECERRLCRMVDEEPPARVRTRITDTEKRARRWRKINRTMIAGSFVIVLVCDFLLTFNLLKYEESLLETLAFMIAVSIAGIGMPLVEEKREKYEVLRLWLPEKEYLADEQNRLHANIRLDKRTSWMLAAAIGCAAVYLAPLRSPVLIQVVYLCAVIFVMAVLQIHDWHKIRELQKARDEVAMQLRDLLSDGE